MGSAEALEVIAAVLATLIGMYQYLGCLPAPPNCRQQRIKDELTAEHCLHGPSNDFA